MNGLKVACSWSGGKDSCLALWRTLRAGARLDCLLTMFTEDGERSRSHGLSRAVLEAQAAVDWSAAAQPLGFVGQLRSGDGGPSQ